MEEKHLRRIKVRRGSNLQRKQVLFEDGEFVYVNDIKKLYVGDVKKYGGHKVSNNNQVILKKFKPINADIGDILYNKLDKSAYIVNKSEELELITFSSDDFYKYLKKIQELEKLLDDLDKFCCNTEFALDTDDGINILADYGDWIKVKDQDLSIISCKPPIIGSKYLKLKTNKVYTLDITNPTLDSDILFLDNLADRDTNDVPKNVKIIQNSVVASDILNILEIKDTTIKFTVKPLKIGTYIGTGIYIDYNIENECGAVQTQKGSIGGYVLDSNISYLTRNIDETKLVTSFKNYTMYQILDPDTKDYPWDKGCWFLFYFNAFAETDNYYITMFDRFPTLYNGNVTISDYTYGPIGPVKDKGMYLFYHPKDTDLNIWNQGNGTNEWKVFPIYNTEEHPNSEKRFFTNKDIRPTNTQIQNLLNDKNLTFEKDYTNIYDGNILPLFIQVYL